MAVQPSAGTATVWDHKEDSCYDLHREIRPKENSVCGGSKSKGHVTRVARGESPDTVDSEYGNHGGGVGLRYGSAYMSTLVLTPGEQSQSRSRVCVLVWRGGLV